VGEELIRGSAALNVDAEADAQERFIYRNMEQHLGPIYASSFRCPCLTCILTGAALFIEEKLERGKKKKRQMKRQIIHAQGCMVSKKSRAHDLQLALYYVPLHKSEE
jgi:hypothetical protein